MGLLNAADLDGAPPPMQVELHHAVQAGGTLALTAFFEGSHHEQLAGRTVRLLRGETTHAHARLQQAIALNDGVHLADLCCQAPTEIGTHTFVVQLDGELVDGTVLPAAQLRVEVEVHAPSVSLLAWDLPTQARLGQVTQLAVGAHSSAGQSLDGAVVEMVNVNRAVVGRARLSAKVLEGTEAVYWAHLAFTPTCEQGLQRFELQLTTNTVGQLHHSPSEHVHVWVLVV